MSRWRSSGIIRLGFASDELRRVHEQDMAYCRKLGEELVDKLAEKCENAEKQRDLFEAESKRKDESIKHLLVEKEALAAEGEELKRKMTTMFSKEAMDDRWDEGWQDARLCILHKIPDFDWDLVEKALEAGLVEKPCEADDFWARKLGEKPRPPLESASPKGQSGAPENAPPRLNIPPLNKVEPREHHLGALLPLRSLSQSPGLGQLSLESCGSS